MKKRVKRDKKVVVGGTFDIFHKGHETLLKRAFGLGKVIIGLTSNAMAEKMKRRKVRDFKLRKKELENFIKKEFKQKPKIVKIENKFGFTLKKDFDYIVVSPKTYETAVLLNKERQKRNKKPIKIVKIKFVLARDRKPISSTRILKGEIDRQGKLLKLRDKIYQTYLNLSKKYGRPRGFWKKWCKRRKTKKDREEIVLGAILTQRTNWQNVELALKNLKEAKSLSIEKIYQIGNKDRELLEKLIKPSGFYRQKAKRIFELCKFLVENYGSLEKFFGQDLETCRNQLLEIYGIGPETADSILLYAGDEPIFVIDQYTLRFVKEYKLSQKFSYDELQNLFQQSLPKDPKVYQDFHAIIVSEEKGLS